MLSPRMRGVISCIASLLVSRSLSVSFVSHSFVSLVDAQGPDLYTKGATGNGVSGMMTFWFGSYGYENYLKMGGA